jgi:hypothetical protein
MQAIEKRATAQGVLTPALGKRLRGEELRSAYECVEIEKGEQAEEHEEEEEEEEEQEEEHEEEQECVDPLQVAPLTEVDRANLQTLREARAEMLHQVST